MDFGNFLNELNEDNKLITRVSSEQLREASGESASPGNRQAMPTIAIFFF